MQKAISSVVDFIRNIPEGRTNEQGGISFRIGSAGNVDGDREKAFGGLIWIKREKAPTSNTPPDLNGINSIDQTIVLNESAALDPEIS